MSGEHVDVAVVGASAAGLRAAWAAARGGASVVLLEARERIGVPEPVAVVGFDLAWDAVAQPSARAIRRRVRGVRLVSPSGHAVNVEASARILDRTRFDDELARDAEAAGARIETSVRGLRVGADRALKHDAGQVRARVVVFADGAGTLARRFLAPVARPDELRWGAMHVLEGESEGADAIQIRVGDAVAGGRAQLNPLGDGRSSHWTFVRGSREDALAAARRALPRDVALAGLSESAARSARFVAVAPDTVHMIPRELVADGVMVAGGAAGQGGIEAGLAAGELAGAVAARAIGRSTSSRRASVMDHSASARGVDRAALVAYERAWKRRYLRGYEALARAVDRLSRISDDALDDLFGAWAGRTLAARDATGLVHASLARRVEAGARAMWKNPRGAARLAAAALETSVRSSARSAPAIEQRGG
ncbi:MAG: NAD(P)/FAD-dependent oxidoreductase [Thermoplasmatota archaeon]